MTYQFLRHVALVCVLVAAPLGTARLTYGQAPPETIEYYATDALGSVRIVFNAAGQVLGRSGYKPFGEGMNESGALPHQRFTGQERDGEAGLDYFNARSLQVRTGRMNAPDPLFGNALGDPQRWNRYAYVAKNPLSMNDPTGMSPADANRDGQFFAADASQLDAIMGGGGADRLDASGHTMGAIDWTDLAHEYLVGEEAKAEQAKKQNANPQVTTSISARLPDGSVQGIENAIVCPPVTFIVTGIGPKQAPNTTAITLVPRAQIPNGGVAVKPGNFGVDLPLTSGTRSVLSGVTFHVDWPAGQVPRGIPTLGPFFAEDNVGPASVRNAPGNLFDVYNYQSYSQAFAGSVSIVVEK